MSHNVKMCVAVTCSWMALASSSISSPAKHLFFYFKSSLFLGLFFLARLCVLSALSTFLHTKKMMTRCRKTELVANVELNGKRNEWKKKNLKVKTFTLEMHTNLERHVNITDIHKGGKWNTVALKILVSFDITHCWRNIVFPSKW